MFKCAEDVCCKDLGTEVIMTNILGRALMPWTSGESSGALEGVPKDVVNHSNAIVIYEWLIVERWNGSNEGFAGVVMYVDSCNRWKPSVYYRKGQQCAHPNRLFLCDLFYLFGCRSP